MDAAAGPKARVGAAGWGATPVAPLPAGDGAPADDRDASDEPQHTHADGGEPHAHAGGAEPHVHEPAATLPPHSPPDDTAPPHAAGATPVDGDIP
jgi:hypothetical protein